MLSRTTLLAKCRLHKRVTRVLATTLIPLVGTLAPPPVPLSFFDEVRNRPAAIDLTDTLFRTIEEAKLPLSPATPAPGLWSLGYDLLVVRVPYSRDVSHLGSLLEALIQGKNFTRAKLILASMYPLSTPQTYTHLFNQYLAGWSEDDLVSPNDMQQFISSFSKRYTDLELNDRTHALVVAKYVKLKENIDEYLSKFDNHQLRKIFSNIDVLDIDTLSVVFALDLVTEKTVPQDLIKLVELVKSKSNPIDDTPDYFKSDSVQAPSVDKDMDELKAVGSFGIKVIRHTLLGLNKDTNCDEINQLLKDLDVGDSKSKIDFYQIYRLLKTPEQRVRYNEAIDAFNQLRQQELELRGLDGAREKWKHAFEDMQRRGGLNLSRDLNLELFKWYQELLPLVQQEAAKCQLMMTNPDLEALSEEEKKQAVHREHYAPYFNLLSPEKLCVITILELLRLNSTGGVVDGMRAARALLSVGRAVELEYRSQNYVKQEKKQRKTRLSNEWRRLLRQSRHRVEKDEPQVEWLDNVLGKLGSVLVLLLIGVAKVPVKATDPATGKQIKGNQPVFYHTYQFVHGQKIGVIKIHRDVMMRLAGKDISACIQPQLLPMLVPPKRWINYNSGGFMYTLLMIVRNKDSPETTAYLKAASEQGKLDQVYLGLNVLGNTAWTINRRLFEVVTHYWNTGEAFLSMPPMNNEPKLGPRPPANAEPQEKFAYANECRAILNEAAGLRSQRCDTNYKLEIARAFIGEKMYFPHNLDFRGRAYPLSPHLNHLGNDLVRSLFLFWDGRELGERGLTWLKIHMSNVFGYDKALLVEREKFAEENLENIRNLARDPFAADAWWKKAEKPWQALGVCFELAEAHELDDPTKYLSHLPIHQDGTCNGLQHYAALGGDVEGAKQVNLLPSDRPQDVYKFVANLVQKRVDADAAAGVKEAIRVQNLVTRKVVKQTVMTNVYGVTFVGAIAQIQKQLAKYVPKDEANPLAKYLTLQVFASIRQLFAGAHDIQDWLGEVARRVSKLLRIDYEEVGSEDPTKPTHLSLVIWTTPLGLPCVQPYRMGKTKVIKTNLQDITLADPFEAGQVDSRKQMTAFPPNFVHSLDATHMLLTAKACGDREMSFAAVHDSYWTHAADVDFMNEQIRSQFIGLHLADLVHQLKDEFENRYKGFLQVVTVPVDHPVLTKVRSIRKEWASKAGRPVTVADEIYMERKRRSLLALTNPDNVKVGQEMVTTVSVTENLDLTEAPTMAKTGAKVLVPLVFPEVPAKGDFDLNEVAKSPYFFS